MKEYQNKLAKLVGELIVLGLTSDEAVQVLIDYDVPKFESSEYNIDMQWQNLLQSGRDMLQKKNTIVSKVIAVFSSLIGSELYIEISSSISGKVYESSVDRVTIEKDEDDKVESITIEYMDSIFVIWTQDIMEILENDNGFIGEGEEYDEDFKFVIGLHFQDDMFVYVYKNEYIEDDDLE